MFVTAALAVTGDGGEPGRAGMTMQYSIQIVWSLAWFVMQLTNVEAQAVSIERIQQFSTVAPEETADDIMRARQPPAS